MELAQITGYEPRTIQAHLKALHLHKLAVRHGNSWRTARRGSLDAVAARLEVAGAGALRAQRHRVDRELHAWWLDEQQWRRRRSKHTGAPAAADVEAGTAQQAIPIPTGPRRTYGRFPVTGGGADYTTAAAIVARRIGAAQLADEATLRAAARSPQNRTARGAVGAAA